jgi:thioredoxin
MKNLGVAVLTALLSMSCLSCNGQQKNTDKDNKVTTKETKMKTIQMTKADFLTKVANYEANPNEWKYLGDKPAIIDFYADWCGPCRAIAPSLEELAEEYGGKIYIYRVDTEKEQELAGVFGIRSIPSLLFIPMTGKPQMAQGALPKSDLKKAIDEFLLKAE